MGKSTANHTAMTLWSRAWKVMLKKKKYLDLNCQTMGDKVSPQVWVHLILKHSKWLFEVLLLFHSCSVWLQSEGESSWRDLKDVTESNPIYKKRRMYTLCKDRCTLPHVHPPSSSHHLYHRLADLGTAWWFDWECWASCQSLQIWYRRQEGRLRWQPTNAPPGSASGLLCSLAPGVLWKWRFWVRWSRVRPETSHSRVMLMLLVQSTSVASQFFVQRSTDVEEPHVSL